MSEAAGTGRRSAAWMVLQQLMTLAMTGLFAIVFARIAPVSVFGEYSFVITVAALAVAVANGGVQSLGIKLFHERPSSAKSVLNSIIAVRESVAVICFLGVLIAAAATGDRNLLLATAIGGLAVFARALDAPELYFQSTFQAKLPALVRLSVGLAFFIGRLVVMQHTFELHVFVLIYLAEFVVISVLLLMLAKRFAGWSPRSSAGLRDAPVLAKKSLPLYLSAVANQVNLKVDVLLLQVLAGSTAVGLYSAAARVSEMLYIIPVAYMTATFPVLLNVKAGGSTDAYRRNLQVAYDSAFWIGIAFVAATYFLADIGIEILFGNAYAAAAEVLRIHALACPFIFMSAVLSKWIVAEGKLWVSIFRHMVGAVTAVALNVALIPIFGIIGSAWATVASYSLASFFFAFLSKHTMSSAVMMLKSVVAPVRYSPILLRRLLK